MDKKNLEYKLLKELGLLISDLRFEKGIGRMEFSKLTGLSRQHLYYQKSDKEPQQSIHFQLLRMA